MTNPTLRFKVNAEMEAALEQRRENLKMRVQDISRFEAESEIAAFEKQQKAHLLTENKTAGAKKAEGVLLNLEALPCADAVLEVHEETEQTEDSSEVEVIEHSEVERVTLEQELEYLRNRALMQKEDAYFKEKAQLAETQRVEYEQRIKQSRFAICNQLLNELISNVCGTIDEEEAIQDFNQKFAEIEELFPLYDEKLDVCISKKNELLQQYLTNGTLYGEAAQEEEEDVYDFAREIEMATIGKKTANISLSDRFGVAESSTPLESYPELHLRVITNDETTVVNIPEIEAFIGKENLFCLQNPDEELLETYKTYFEQVLDNLRQLATVFKPKVGEKAGQIEEISKQSIEINDQLMIIPTIESDKFVKNATFEQIIEARIHYLMYRKAGLVGYWFCEQLQISGSSKSIHENDMLDVEFANIQEIPIESSVYTSIKGIKGLSEIEQQFSFVSVAKLRFEAIYRQFNTEELQDPSVASNMKPSTPKRDIKRPETTDTLKENIELSEKSKYSVVYQSAFDEVVYITKNTVSRFEHNIAPEKSAKNKNDEEQMDEEVEEIERKSFFQYKELLDIELVEINDESTAILQSMYKAENTELVFIKADELNYYTELDFADIGAIENASIYETKDPLSKPPGNNLKEILLQVLANAFKVKSIDLDELKRRIQDDNKRHILYVVAEEYLSRSRMEQREALFRLHLLMKILFEASMLLNSSAFFSISQVLKNCINEISSSITCAPEFDSAQQTLITDYVHAMRQHLLDAVAEVLNKFEHIPCLQRQYDILCACERVSVSDIKCKMQGMRQFLQKYLENSSLIKQFEEEESAEYGQQEVLFNDIVVLEVAAQLNELLEHTFEPFYVVRLLKEMLGIESHNGTSFEDFQRSVENMAQIQVAINDKFILCANSPEMIDDVLTDILRKFELIKPSKSLQNSVFGLAMTLKLELQSAAQRAENAAKTVYLLALQAIRRSQRKMAELTAELLAYHENLVNEHIFTQNSLIQARQELSCKLDCEEIEEQFSAISRPSELLCEVANLKESIILHRDVNIGSFIEKYEIDSERALEECAKAVFVTVKRITTQPDPNPKAKKGAVIETAEYSYFDVPLLRELGANLQKISKMQFDDLLLCLRDGPLQKLTLVHRDEQKLEAKRAKDEPAEVVGEEPVYLRFEETETWHELHKCLEGKLLLGSPEQTHVWVHGYFSLFSNIMINENQQTIMLAITLFLIPVEGCDYEQKLVKLFEMQSQKAIKFVRHAATIRDVVELLWRSDAGQEIDNMQSQYCNVARAVKTALSGIEEVEREPSPKPSSRKGKK